MRRGRRRRSRWGGDFEIVWQSRETEEIRFADPVSKDFDCGNYRISDSDFGDLVGRFGMF